MNKRPSNQQSIEQVLQQIVQMYGLEEPIRCAKIKQAWRTVMGDGIANETSHIYVKEHTLCIVIASAALKQELFFAREKIKQLINKQIKENFIFEVQIR